MNPLSMFDNSQKLPKLNFDDISADKEMTLTELTSQQLLRIINYPDSVASPFQNSGTPVSRHQ